MKQQLLTLSILVVIVLVTNIITFIALWRWMKRRDRAQAENIREMLRLRYELEMSRKESPAMNNDKKTKTIIINK